MNLCVILFRVNGGPVQAVCDDHGAICEFADGEDAISFLEDWPPWKSGEADTQIVQLDEL
jgi:hypothetical protein